MKYEQLSKQFWIKNANYELSANIIAIYLFILFKCEEQNKYNIDLSETQIKLGTGISNKTIRKVREKLREMNLVDFELKIGSRTTYRLVPLNEDVTNAVPETQSVRVPKKQVGNFATQNIPFKEKANKILCSLQNPDAPSVGEFLEFAKTVRNYTSDLDSKIEGKYRIWVENGWQTESNRPITNWKQLLKSMMPYIINGSGEIIDKKLSIPAINRPKNIN